MKKKDFDKAVKKKMWGHIFISLYCSAIALGLIASGINIYNLAPNDSSYLFIFAAIVSAFAIASFVTMIELMINRGNKGYYNLCKRCKYLVKKDKVFCNNCKRNIRSAIEGSNDKKYFKEYQKIAKKEKKK